MYKHYNETVNSRKYKLIREIIDSGMKPIMTELKSGIADKELAYLIESEYIDLYKFKGYNLLNILTDSKMLPSNKGNAMNESQKRECFDRSPLKKKVSQFDKKGNFINDFDGVREACRITGVDHRSIAQVAGGSKIRKSAGGFIWKYL